MITWTVPPSTRPGGAGDVGGALGAEEDDRRGDLARARRGGRSGACAPASASASSRLSAPRDLASTGRAGRPAPSTSPTSTGPGADRVDEDAALRVAVGEEARERELGRLRDRVLGHRRRGALAGGRADVDDPAPAALGHRRDRRPHRPQRRHHVELVLRRASPRRGPRRGRASWAAPALLTSTSSAPKRSSAAASIRSPASSSVTSSASGAAAAAGRLRRPRRLLGRRRQALLAARDEQHVARPRRRAAARSRGRCRGWRR